MKISKLKIFLSIPLLIYSIEFYFGIIFGYLAAKYLSGKETGQSGIMRSLILHIGNWKLHLHHWLFASGIILSALFLNFHLPLTNFSFGLLGGFAFQGIYCYSDWHKIIFKKGERDTKQNPSSY